MSKEIEEKIKRIEIIVARAYKLARLVRRRHNQVTEAFNKNFEVFNENVDRNTANIDKIVSTLQELMGTKPDDDKKPIDRSINDDIRKLYL